MERVIIDRMNYVCEHYSVSGNYLSKQLGVSQQMVSRYLKGLSTPTGDFIEKFAKYFNNVSLQWLFFGVGNMLIDESKDTITPFDVSIGETRPVLPVSLIREPNLNLSEYVEGNDVQEAPVIQQFPSYDMIVPVPSWLAENVVKESNLIEIALQRIPRESIINGRRYGIDTVHAGLLIGYISVIDDSFVFLDPRHLDEEPAKIPSEEVYTVYRIVGVISIP